jgi:hypothetical protein
MSRVHWSYIRELADSLGTVAFALFRRFCLGELTFSPTRNQRDCLQFERQRIITSGATATEITTHHSWGCANVNFYCFKNLGFYLGVWFKW